MQGMRHTYDKVVEGYLPFSAQSNKNPFPQTTSHPPVPIYHPQSYNTVNPTFPSIAPPTFHHPPSNVAAVTSIANLNPIGEHVMNKMRVPDGMGSLQYPPPNPGAFDSTTGLHYDANTGLHYDSHAGYFFDSLTKRYLRWEPTLQTYLRVDTHAGSIVPNIMHTTSKTTLNIKNTTPESTLPIKPDPLEDILRKSQEHRKAVEDKIKMIASKMLTSDSEEDKKASQKKKGSKSKKWKSAGRKKDNSHGKKRSSRRKSSSTSGGTSTDESDSPIKKRKPTKNKLSSEEHEDCKFIRSSRTPEKGRPSRGESTSSDMGGTTPGSKNNHDRRRRSSERDQSSSHSLRLKRRSRSPSPRLKQKSRSPFPRLKPLGKSPSPRLKRRIRSPSPKFRQRTKSPCPKLKPQRRSPSPRLKQRSRSPSPRLKRRIRSPSPRFKRQIRSPSPRFKRQIRSPSPRLKRRSKSPSPRLKRRIRSPSPKFRQRTKSPCPKLKPQRRSPSPRLKQRSRSPSPRLKRRTRSPSPRFKRQIRSPSPRFKRQIRSPSPRLKQRSKSPSPRLKRRIRSPSPRLKQRSRSHRKEQSLSPKGDRQSSPRSKNRYSPRHERGRSPGKKRHSGSQKVLKMSSDGQSRLSPRNKHHSKARAQQSKGISSEKNEGESTIMKPAACTQVSNEENQGRENTRLKRERDLLLPKRSKIEINFDLEQVICPVTEPSRKILKMAAPSVSNYSENPAVGSGSLQSTSQVGGADDDLSMLDQYDEILDYGDSEDEAPEPAAMEKSQKSPHPVVEGEENVIGVEVDNLVDEISESIDNLLGEDGDEEKVTDQKNVVDLDDNAQCTFIGEVNQLAVKEAENGNEADGEALAKETCRNSRRWRQRQKKIERRRKGLLQGAVTDSGSKENLPQVATSVTNSSSGAEDHLIDIDPTSIQRVAIQVPLTPVLREMSPTLSAIVDDNASIGDCAEIAECDEVVEAKPTEREKFVFENILKKSKPSDKVLITSGPSSQKSSTSFREGIRNLVEVHQSHGWLIRGRLVRVSCHTERSQPFPYAVFCFSSTESAKAWFDRWNGVLPESEGIQYYAFYADDIWMCPHCQLKNFHLRRVCYFCCRLVTNGASPIRFVPEVSRWVAITQAPHDVTEAEMLMTLKKFGAPGDIKLRNIKDPYTRLSCGLFVVQTSIELASKLFSWASAAFPVGTVSYCTLATLGFRDHIFTAVSAEDPGGNAVQKLPFIQLLEKESKIVFAQQLDEPFLIVTIFSSKVGGLQDKFKTALLALFEKRNLPFVGTVCHKVECGAPHDYALLRFPSHEAATKQCSSDRGELTLFYGSWEDSTTVTCNVYFSRGNWTCRDCKFALNYPLRSICRNCCHPKLGFKRPIYKVELPTQWVAVFGVSVDEDEKSILEDLKQFEVTLASFKTFRVLIDPEMKTSCGICLFETVASKNTIELRSKLLNLFSPEEVHYVGVNRTYLEESSTLCRGTAQ